MKELSKYYISFICAIPVNSRNLNLQPHDLFLKWLQAPKIIIEEGEGGIIGKIVHCVAVSFFKLVAGRFEKKGKLEEGGMKNEFKCQLKQHENALTDILKIAS